jgi:hypothetical protein
VWGVGCGEAAYCLLIPFFEKVNTIGGKRVKKVR